MDLFTKIAAAAVPVVTALATLVALISNLDDGKRRRQHLRSDAELLELLPEGEARKKLLKLIELQLDALTTYDTDARRDISSAVFAIIFAVLGTAFSMWVILDLQGWWYWSLLVAVPLTALFAYGIVESVAKVPRDAKGKRTTVSS